MAHAFATHFGDGDFNTALFTNYATVLKALVFAAQAFVVLDRTKNLGAKQTVALWLEGAIVNRFWFAHLAVRPRADLFGRGDANFNGIELFFLRNLFE